MPQGLQQKLLGQPVVSSAVVLLMMIFDTALDCRVSSLVNLLTPIEVHASEKNLNSQSDRIVRLKTLPKHSRIEVRLPKEVDPQFKNIGSKFEIHFPGLSRVDFGLPREADAFVERKWIEKVFTLRDLRLKDIRPEETPGGLTFKGEWRFDRQSSRADDQPSAFIMETFQFSDTTKSDPGFKVFSLDFWQKHVPTEKQVRVKHAEELRKKKELEAETEAQAKKKMELDREKLRADLEDVTKYCSTPLSDMNEVFLTFKSYHEPLAFSRWLNFKNIDTEFVYDRPKAPSSRRLASEAKDDAYARLAFQLMENGSFALAIKTLDFMKKEVGPSKHDAQLQILKAAALDKLELHQAALDVLQFTKAEYAQTVAGAYAATYLAVKSYEKGAFHQSLENFLWLIYRHPDDERLWLYHLGAAESLFELKQIDRSIEEYKQVIAMVSDPGIRFEAVSRVGELFMDRGEFAHANDTYRVFDQFAADPKYVDKFDYPSVFLNRGEAAYRLENYDVAKKFFEVFNKKFSGHPSGWRATLRLAEIAGRAHGQLDENYRRYLKETIDRFPTSSSVTLAWLRMIPCSDHGGMTNEAAERFYAKAENYDGDGVVDLKNYRDLLLVSRFRGYIAFERFDEAVEVALKALSDKRNERLQYILGSNLWPVFRKTILSKIENGKAYQALQFYVSSVKKVPDLLRIVRENGRPDFSILLTLSQVASDYGLGKQAKAIISQYELYQREKVLIADTELEAEKEFSEAKAMWVSKGIKAKPEIMSTLDKIPDDSKYGFYRQLLLAAIAQSEGDQIKTLQAVSKAQLLIPPGGSEQAAIQSRLSNWMGRLQEKTLDPVAALASYEVSAGTDKSASSHGIKKSGESDRKIASKTDAATDSAGHSEKKSEYYLELFGVPAQESLAEISLRQAEIFRNLKRWNEASVYYSKTIENGLTNNRVLYEYFNALEQAGERKRALATLEEIAKSEKDDFWKKLAQEALANPFRGGKKQ